MSCSHIDYDDNNIFAKILRGEIPCNKVYEDDYVLAFHDIAPKKKVHVLVIPKGKYVSIHDFGTKAPADEIKGFYEALSKISHDLEVADKGYRVICNVGEDGGQEVPHFHAHILGGEPVGAMVEE